MATVSSVFFLVFFGLGFLAAQLGRSFPLYLEWETAIPCIPWMAWIYLSAFALVVLPLIHMTPREMSVLSQQLTVAILIAGAGYLALPGQAGYPTMVHPGADGAVIAFLDELAKRSGPNLVPSLHVALGTIIVLDCIRLVRGSLSYFYCAWLMLVCCSTILTHQHHLLDVATGLIVAIVVRRLIPVGPADQRTARKASHQARTR